MSVNYSTYSDPTLG